MLIKERELLSSFSITKKRPRGPILVPLRRYLNGTYSRLRITTSGAIFYGLASVQDYVLRLSFLTVLYLEDRFEDVFTCGLMKASTVPSR